MIHCGDTNGSSPKERKEQKCIGGNAMVAGGPIRLLWSLLLWSHIKLQKYRSYIELHEISLPGNHVFLNCCSCCITGPYNTLNPKRAMHPFPHSCAHSSQTAPFTYCLQNTIQRVKPFLLSWLLVVVLLGFELMTF